MRRARPWTFRDATIDELPYLPFFLSRDSKRGTRIDGVETEVETSFASVFQFDPERAVVTTRRKTHSRATHGA